MTPLSWEIRGHFAAAGKDEVLAMCRWSRARSPGFRLW